MSSTAIENSIKHIRQELSSFLCAPLKRLSDELVPIFHDRNLIENHLKHYFAIFKQCKHLYVLDNRAIQLTSNLTRDGIIDNHYGRDRSTRPYMQFEDQNNPFYLSEAYISKNKKRPSVTAVHKIIDPSGQLLGYVGIDYDLRELPNLEQLLQEHKQHWQQIKGDPAIRGSLFTQQRIQSQMDMHMDDIFALMEELFVDRGIFHGKFHFSSSRTTIWSVTDPYSYQILTLAELIDPDVCLLFERRPYFEKAIVPAEKIRDIFEYFRRLRFADENIYLRAGSINIVNGMVGLNFSCDGSHYLPYGEFLDKGLSFWFGKENDLDSIVESICEKGCREVYRYIDEIQQGMDIPEFANLSKEEKNTVLYELNSIMDVYRT